MMYKVTDLPGELPRSWHILKMIFKEVFHFASIILNC